MCVGVVCVWLSVCISVFVIESLRVCVLCFWMGVVCCVFLLVCVSLFDICVCVFGLYVVWHV